MKKIIWPIAIIAAFAAPVYAQNAVEQRPTGTSVPQELTFKVSPAEVDIIAKGLESQPYKEVVPLLQKLREQFVAQQSKAPAVPQKEEKKD